MPADVTYMYGVSPPFAYGNNLLSIHDQAHPYFSASCKSSDFTSQTLSRVPRCSLTNRKSCLKAFHRANVLCKLKNSKDSTHCRFNEDNSAELVSTNTARKRVTFADAQGGALTLIKYLTESTNEPPKSLTSGDLIQDLMKNLNLVPSKDQKKKQNKTKLLLQFDQPVADYVSFKRKIDSGCVSLENVLLKDNCCIHGTVKVKNIAFDKLVAIRITFDDWKTEKDVQCDYVKNAYETGQFDTFQFDISVDETIFNSNISRIQFCVRYTCGNEQFWDNNSGKNYVIASSQPLNSDRPTSQSISVPQRNSKIEKSKNVDMLIPAGRAHPCSVI